MVNDIGQIVVPRGAMYNTPEGVMAGYNVSKMTDETFTDRIGTIENTLRDKYDLTDEEIADVKAGNYKGDVNTDLFDRIRNIEIARRNFAKADKKTDQIVDLRTDTKTNNQNQNQNQGDGTYGVGSDGQASFDSGQGFGVNATTGGPVSNKTGRGRTDYKHGGLASIL